jgi:hypothetical protein
LKEPAGSIGAMRQQTMKARGDRKHSHDVERQANDDCNFAYACPDDQQASEMQEEKLRANKIVQAILIGRVSVF